MKPFKTRAFCVLMALIVLVVSVSFTGKVSVRAEDAEFEELLLSFPESYREDLRVIHSEYPNWKFVAVNTGMNWNKVVAGESQLGYSLVDGSSRSSWKSTQYGAYDWTTESYRVLDSGGWVQASKEIIAYYLDPRCYLDSTYVFAFLDYSYDPEAQTLEGLERMVEGTFLAGYFYENDTSYYYPSVLIEAAETYNMNPYVLAMMIINEQGAAGVGAQIGDGNAYFNYFSIGAYAADGMNAAERGVWYASLEGSYGRPWDTRYKAILGGAEFYVENYVNAGQNTLYYKKFNVNPNTTYPFFSHQYMTNIQGAAQEAYILSYGYSEQVKQEALVFEIPVFDNMPETLGEKPTGTGSPDNRLKLLEVEGFDLSPKFDNDTEAYTIVVSEDTTQITISGDTVSSLAYTEGFGTFSLRPGVVNVFHVYVTAENGQERHFSISLAAPGVAQSEEEPDDLEDSSQNENDDSGEEENSQGGNRHEDHFIGSLPEGTTTSLIVSETLVHGLPSLTTTPADLMDMIKLSSGSVRIVTAEGEEVTENVATGHILEFLSEDGEILAAFEIVLYGDATGDGAVSSVDLLKIQKYILGQAELMGAFWEAADANHDTAITSVDLLKIQKAILGLTIIEQ